MASKGKIKGTTYEYKIRDLFSKEFDRKFERVPLSGALEYLKGDIFCPHWPQIPWTIELKHHKEVDWNNLLTATKSNLLIKFWEQTTREAEVMKKLPLLIYRWDRGKDYVCWTDEGAHIGIEVADYIHINVNGESFRMALLKDWLVEAKKVI
jgi:hypothetical protein